jgi:hypothetical protein
MAQTNFTPILTYKSDTATSVPSASNLTNSANGAELAVNTADKRLFTKDSGGNVVEVGTNPSSLTMPNGTANGVVYANGSKVLTSGSALTFSGSALSVTGTVVSSNSGNENFFLSDGSVTSSLQNGANSLYFNVNTNSATNGYFIWRNTSSYSEQMRLTSTGLGIGTSSPATKLSVNGNARLIGTATSSVSLGFGTDDGVSGWSIGNGIIDNTHNFRIYDNTNGAARLTIDNSGNLGLGVTPSAWGSSYKALEVGGVVSYFSSANQYFGMYANAYRNSGGSLIYTTTGVSSGYLQDLGAHKWFSAASGTAGNAISFTQAMTLDASGRLGIGQTSPSYVLDTYDTVGQARFSRNKTTTGDMGGLILAGLNASSSAISYALIQSNASTVTAGSEAGNLDFYTMRSGSITQAARIDSSGNLLVGTTSNAPSGLYTRTFSVGNSTYGAIGASCPGSGASYPVYFQDSDNTSGTQVLVRINRASTNVGNIYTSNTATTYGTSSDYRLKNTIAPMTGALAKVAQLKPVTYKWNTDNSDGEGFIAHELAEVVPQAVAGEKDALDSQGNPKYQNIDTSFLVATLTAALQELNAKFDAYVASHP